MLNFLQNNWLNILLVIVGLSTFGVYIKQKSDEKRIAATLIKEQIDIVEERVLSLKSDYQLGNISVYHSRLVLHENMWERYKHLLIKKLSKSDIVIIQKFFDRAEQIEQARSDIIRTITYAWEHKSQVEHQVVGELLKDGIEKKVTDPPNEKTDFHIEMNKIEVFRQIYRPLDLVFTPDLSINALIKRLNDFDMLSGTTAYKVIQSLSYDKK